MDAPIPSAGSGIAAKHALLGLFEFSRELVGARNSTLMSMRSTGLGLFPENELRDLPGLTLGVDEDGGWLRLERLRETSPPIPDPILIDWIDGRIDLPDRRPVPNLVVVRDSSIEEVSDLCEGGLLDLEDISRIEDDDANVRIGLRLERLTELAAMLESWTSGPWEAWAVDERERRRSIGLYNGLYKLHGQMHGGAPVPPELVWGMGIAKWRPEGALVDMPVLERLVDLEVRDGGALCIVPRDVKPVVSLRPFLELDVQGAARTQTYLQDQFALIEGDGQPDVTPFEPTAWEHLLDAAATRLSPDAVHVAQTDLLDGAEVAAPSSTLTVYSSWALYGRQRSESVREQDLDALAKRIEAASDDGALPDGLRGFVSRPPAEDLAEDDDWGLRRDLSAAPAHAERASRTAPANAPVPPVEPARTYFFPLPFNEEQARIIDRLETEPVVTVTGPPGTGKTHSIANIVSHYMATGRRVLVTARTAEAIAAVRDKLPDELASLVIASVGSDRDGSRQLERAIERLSADVASLDVDGVLAERDRLEAAIVADDAGIRECDARLSEIALANLSPLIWQGHPCTAMELTGLLGACAAEYGWLSDRPTAEPPVTLERTVDELRDSLARLGDDLAYLDARLPTVDELPSAPQLIDAHERERAHRHRPVEDFGEQPPMDRSVADADALATTLEALLDQVGDKVAGQQLWVRTLLARATDARLSGDPEPAAFRVATEAAALSGDAGRVDVTFEAAGVERTEFAEAVERGTRGEAPLPFGASIFKSALAKAVGTVRVDGEPPISSAQWRSVADHIRLEAQRPRLAERWEPLAHEGELPALPRDAPGLAETVRDAARRVPRIAEAADKIAGQADALESLFPYGLDVRRCLGALDLAPLLAALKANRRDTWRTPAAIDRLTAIGEHDGQTLLAAIATLAADLGGDDIDGGDIVSRRNALVAEIGRVSALGPDLEATGRALGLVADAGSPGWAEALRSDPARASDLLPADWPIAWEWARLRGRLDEIVDMGNGDDWRERRTELKRRRERNLETLIRQRTLLGLKRRMTPNVLTALTTFTMAATKLGKGTGASAGKWRAVMRKAAVEAAPAAPVWVMPEYKIPEQLAPILGDFDLVILDEASQSDITSIGSLARGKKQLIVGDEKQVSPTSVGVSANKVSLLVATHLKDLPHRDSIDENTSIFDIARQMYPRSHLMLREHFRCVEPIIGFSARFYDGRLVPLRVPKASERFDPPLVDIHVEGATRAGKTNVDEARVIVDEIAAIVADPVHRERDIAVISLIGAEQAELIERRLMEDARVGTSMIDRHRILCGDSRTMQGQERNIVFLSMVATPGNAVVQSNAATQQRFNVALSRARDRMVLVRSVGPNDLRLGDLKLDVIEHFANSMPEGRRTDGTDILARCDSNFEREVCQRLLDANYRVRAQVSAGPFRIDLVVEGGDDRRLAIELDGDHWHGPDRWEQDMARQAALERAGWTFWRVFGSQWQAEKEYRWESLVATLDALGIEPIGVEATDETFTEFRTVRVGGASAVLEGIAAAEEDAATKLASGPAPSRKPEAGLAPDANDRDVDGPPAGESALESILASAATRESSGPTPDAIDDIPFELETHVLPTLEARKAASALDLDFDVDTDDAVENSTDVDMGEPSASATTDEPDSPLDLLPDRFYDDDYRDTLVKLVHGIIDVAGPIVETDLCQRVARLHGFKRTGAKIRGTVLGTLGASRGFTKGRCDTNVWWPDTVQPAVSMVFRGMTVAGVERHWDDLPHCECMGLTALAFLEDPDDMVGRMQAHLGLKALRTSMRAALTTTIEEWHEGEASGRFAGG